MSTAIKRQLEPPGAVRFFVLLAFALSWGLGGVLLALRYNIAAPGPALLLGAAPSIAALLIAARIGGVKGCAELLGRLVRPFQWRWLAIALLMQPLIVLALWLSGLSGGGEKLEAIFEAGGPLAVVMAMGGALLKSGPLGEELGWRGFALPQLLQITSPLIASLAVATIWVIWHIPGFLFGFMSSPLNQFGWFALSDAALSVVMTWVFLRAKGNVLVAGVVPHFIGNALGEVGFWAHRPAEAVALAVVAAVIVVVDWKAWLTAPVIPRA